MSIDTVNLEEYKKMSEIIFPDISETPADLQAKYPPRKHISNSWIGRFAPSPTGFIHIGGIFAALVNRMATLNGGTFILRIEDTDQKREVEQGVEKIIETLNLLNILPDEGPFRTNPIEERGNYGPYIQSNRFRLYKVFAKDVISHGLAYPCFMTDAELEMIRKEQTEKNLQPGVYGAWAHSRQLPFEEIIGRIEKGDKFVIRLRADADTGEKIQINDLVRGTLEFPANNVDTVLLKSDGLPTYHFAHVVDEYLMRINLVLRGDEWISSLPLHVQLHGVIRAPMPQYAHFGPIAIMEGTSRRKLSKRKDPEAAMSYYYEKGYPSQAVIEYLLNLANSGFEEWRVQHPAAAYLEFPFKIEQLGKTSMLFDLNKLENISKDIIANYRSEELYDRIIEWCKIFQPALLPILSENPLYATQVLNIGRSGDAPRKDLAKWADFNDVYGFFFDPLFDRSVSNGYDGMPELDRKDTLDILGYLSDTIFMLASEDKNTWLNRMRQFATDNHYALRGKDYEKNRSQYKGWLGDIMMVFRVAITGKAFTPDLYDVIQVMGLARVKQRLDKAIDNFSTQS